MSRQIVVIGLDDTPARQALQEAFSTRGRVVVSVDAARDLAAMGRPALVVAPFSTVEGLQADHFFEGVAFVGYGDVDDAAAFARCRADEVVFAPLVPAELVARCGLALRRSGPHPGVERRRRDHVTGLATGATVTASASAIEARFSPIAPVALAVVVRVDGLPEINATYGASIGDRVLRAACDGLRAAASDHAVVARLGGLELLVLEPFDPASDGHGRADGLAAAARGPHVIAGLPLSVSACHGWEVAPLNDGVAAIVARARSSLSAGSVDADVPPPAEPPRSPPPTGATREEPPRWLPVFRFADGAVVGLRALSGETGVGDAIFAAVVEQTTSELVRSCPEASMPRRVSFRVPSDGSAEGSLRRFVDHGLGAIVAAGWTPDVILAPRALRDSVLSPMLDAIVFGGGQVAVDFGEDVEATREMRLPPAVTRVEIDRKYFGVPYVVSAIGRLRAAGIAVTGRRIETGAHAEAARQAGCSEGCGFHFTPPISLVRQQPGASPAVVSNLADVRSDR
jgi:GGDEF domain-containing protein